MGNYNNKKNELYHQGNMILQMANLFVKLIEELEMTNEQFFIDWEDSLNELSVKNHDTNPE